MSKVNKIALISSIVGVGNLVVVIISGASYPDPLLDDKILKNQLENKYT